MLCSADNIVNAGLLTVHGSMLTSPMPTCYSVASLPVRENQEILTSLVVLDCDLTMTRSCFAQVLIPRSKQEKCFSVPAGPPPAPATVLPPGRSCQCLRQGVAQYLVFPFPELELDLFAEGIS